MEFVDYFKTDLHKKIAKRMKPGDYLHELRMVTRLTKAKLGEKIGVSTSRISDFELNQRVIPKEIAKKLGKLYGVSSTLFIEKRI